MWYVIIHDSHSGFAICYLQQQKKDDARDNKYLKKIAEKAEISAASRRTIPLFLAIASWIILEEHELYFQILDYITHYK